MPNTTFKPVRPLGRIALLLGCLLPALITGSAQSAAADEKTAESAQKKRPKICLVLSGGGARGAAHIGVLKVLEEYRVPIDCIAGTSMGALVGAGYATGSSVSDLEQLSREINTELLYKENPPRQEQSIRRKIDDTLNFIGPEFGVDKNGLRLSKGVVSGVQLETVLRKLGKVNGFHHFDRLPIPFRAVATDLVTGKAVIFSKGEIANVMRASMSVPGAVAPAEFDGMMLVDGMLTGNLPVEVARQMGADVVIAVNVGTPLLTREQLGSLLGVTSQMLSILTEQNVERSLKALRPNDVLITPELEGFSTSDFDVLPEIVPRGEAAAREVAKQLAKLSMSTLEYAALRKRQSTIVRPEEPVIDQIQFAEMKHVNPASALGTIETKAGQQVDQEVLDKDMLRLYGTGDYEHVNYKYRDADGKTTLLVDTVEKTWGPNYLRFGVSLYGDSTGESYYDFLVSYRMTWLNRLGAEWRTDVQIGQNNFLETEFYQPLRTDGLFFVAPYLRAGQHSDVFYEGEVKLAEYDVTQRVAGLDLGSHFYRYGEARLGILGGYTDAKLATGPDSAQLEENPVRERAIRFRALGDQLDSALFPRSGWRLQLQVYDSNAALGADNPYTRWDLNGSAAYSVGEHTINFGIQGAGKIGSNPLPAYNQVTWGGFLRQSGYANGQLHGGDLNYGRAMYYHRILRGGLLEGAYGGVSVEYGKISNAPAFGATPGEMVSGAAFAGMDTAVGPAYLGYGRTKDGFSSYYFSLGRPF